MFQEMIAMGSGGGGGIDGVIFVIQHPSTNGASLKTGSCKLSELDSYTNLNDLATDTQSASNYGTVFDFTFAITDHISIRAKSTGNNAYFTMYIIEDGTTIETKTVNTLMEE